MRQIAMTIVTAAFLLSGCKGKDITKDIEALADRACECKDEDCARKVSADLVSLVNSTENASGDKDRGRAAGEKFGKCVIEAGLPIEEVMALGDKLTNM